VNRNTQLTATPVTLDAVTHQVVHSTPARRNSGVSALWRFICMLAIMACVFFGFTPPASAALVTYDGTNVTFSAAELLTPLVSALTVAIAASAVLFIIVVGVRWLFRMVKGRK
jgi:hypothetical protein